MCRFLDFSVFLFLVLPSLVSSLSFDLPSISPKDTNVHINVEGDASITNQGIQLTPYERDSVLNSKAGRATYVESLHLWDKASRELADFTTNFTFNIDSDGNSSFADGLAFFLANFSGPFNGTSIQGGGLGLMNETLPISPDPFVAVVFDTFSHQENRPRTNVSINVKSMLNPGSIKPWFNNITQGMDNNASITYSACSQVLQVVFTGFWKGQRTTESLSYKVDLRENLPEFVSVGFSAATGWFFEKNSVSSWQFNSTSLRSGSVLLSPASSPPPKGKNKKQLVIGLSICVSIIVALLLALAINTCHKKVPDLGQDMDSEFQMVSSGSKKFSYTELQTATNNFAEGQKLGEGGFGGVYRGFLRSLNLDVAVKRVSSGSNQGIKEYAAEVKIISQLRQRNLMPLYGWCHDINRGELLLVYEYMPQGSLDSHLFKTKSPPLNWELRYRIAQGLASALFYLHEEWKQCVLHRDIKSSNVLLDSSFDAKLGDFGLASLVDHENAPRKTLDGGTLGYIAPECSSTLQTTKESDVYSFGIVALEIATGQRAILVNEPEGVKITLVEWVWNLYGMEKLMEAADPKLCGNFERPKMEKLMMIGLWCAHPNSTCRLKIREALHCLTSSVQLPPLPPKMPKPVYPTSFSILEGHTSSSNNSCPSRFTSSSIMDTGSSSSTSHSHTH
nr:L-type lectin-domain containing receptor kinase IX.1-like [Ipomoea batatas]GME09769.1 L-type lectin-domain containing receptor kinase IX.1-like [Ipomoea batatas]GME09775.1 L-type lectin-domain containing receptor kinase IX.1-like [Ipomoea batatas]